MDNAIVVESLAKRFGDVVALDGVDFEVPGTGSREVARWVVVRPAWCRPIKRSRMEARP